MKKKKSLTELMVDASRCERRIEYLREQRRLITFDPDAVYRQLQGDDLSVSDVVGLFQPMMQLYPILVEMEELNKMQLYLQYLIDVEVKRLEGAND